MATPRVAVCLGLGSNLGDRRRNLQQAVALLGAHLRIGRVSGLYETAPVGYDAQPNFLNAALTGDTDAGADVVLRWCKEVEEALGRLPAPRNGPRTVDVDLLLYGGDAHHSRDLMVPHPRLAERAFVLVPLVEVAPAAVHPILGRTAQQLLAALPDRSGVRLVESGDWWKG